MVDGAFESDSCALHGYVLGLDVSAAYLEHRGETLSARGVSTVYVVPRASGSNLLMICPVVVSLPKLVTKPTSP